MVSCWCLLWFHIWKGGSTFLEIQPIMYGRSQPEHKVWGLAGFTELSGHVWNSPATHEQGKGKADVVFKIVKTECTYILLKSAKSICIYPIQQKCAWSSRWLDVTSFQNAHWAVEFLDCVHQLQALQTPLHTSWSSKPNQDGWSGELWWKWCFWKNLDGSAHVCEKKQQLYRSSKQEGFPPSQLKRIAGHLTHFLNTIFKYPLLACAEPSV